MASKYELHYDFPKLAEESGFVFNTHRPRVRIDWNKIRVIDIEGLVQHRKFHLIEQHMNYILDCALENEFDVRILDEGFVKMFRLAQLAVEYQQFCRHYLDRSIYVLREEVTALAQELNVAKKELQEKDDEIKKIRRKTRNFTKTPFGNENIANMILRTLTNKGEMFPSPSTVDILQYNKCNYCDKVFLNQLYLKSHISRRHVMEIPEKEGNTNIPRNQNDNENTQLNHEISELKSKLKNMEEILVTLNKTDNKGNEERGIEKKFEPTSNEKTDVKVSACSDNFLLDKIEEWKREEQEKYNKELNLLRTQIIDTMNTFKDKNTDHKESGIDPSLLEQLNVTIKEQSAEISALKQQIINTKLMSDQEEAELKKKSEAQILIWSKSAEEQSKQYVELCHKLEEVSKDAQKSREQAEEERNTTLHLQSLLQQALSANNASKENLRPKLLTKSEEDNNIIASKKSAKEKPHKPNPTVEGKTLDYLQRAAEQLLKEEYLSSTDTLSSNCEQDQIQSVTQFQNKNVYSDNKLFEKNNKSKKIRNTKLKDNKKYVNRKNHGQSNSHEIKIKTKDTQKMKSNSEPNITEKDNIRKPKSPIKVVRAKLTEEVNNRLTQLGIDPLKSRISKGVFQKQRTLLQQQQELKSKKNLARQVIKHSILTYLDTVATGTTRKSVGRDIADQNSISKQNKPFSFTSVISNVKNKALSLVKPNDYNNGSRRLPISNNSKTHIDIEKSPDSSHVNAKTVVSNIGQIRRTVLTNKKKNKNNKILRSNSLESDDSIKSEIESDNTFVFERSSKSVNSLIQSPVRRPATERKNKLILTSEATEKAVINDMHPISSFKNNELHENFASETKINEETSDDESSHINIYNEEIAAKSQLVTKSVLKNASSMTSLNKKKVIFDMDAIQMKSLSISASPSQSINEKIDGNEKTELDVLNLEDDWDISSIENEPVQYKTEVLVNSRTSPKIAELTKTIESQLARRIDTPSTVVMHGIDILKGKSNLTKTPSLGGSNTSLGSSILDDSDSGKAINKLNKKQESIEHKMDLSNLNMDFLNKNDSF